jgi:DNA-binding PadR family transcriptional regulator
MKLLSRFEEHLLLAITRLGDDAYGVSIRKELKELTGASVSHGAIHSTLERLEKQGYVDSSFSEPESRRGGRRKRLYKVRREGVEALRQIDRINQELWSGVPEMLRR